MSVLLLWLCCVLCLSLSVCVSGSSYPDCVGGPLAGHPICDPTAPVSVRASDFLNMLNVSEKLSRLYSGFGNPSPAIPRLGLPSLEWINDALHGLTSGPNFVFADGDGPYNSSTSFPQPINFGATFDDSLAFAMGNWIAVEARAFTNGGRGGVDLWTPNINEFRDPRWGRGQETPGEDVLLTSRYAFNFVRGMQGGEDPRYYKSIADCKHYAAYDLEQFQGVSRYAYSANVTLQDLVEYYLPAFEACARDAAAGSVMCAYNALNMQPVCLDNWLLQTVLRDDWGYGQCEDCWVVSDCDAVNSAYDSHHWSNDTALIAAVALQAGTDLNCGSFYQQHLPQAYTRGLITDQDINKAVLRLTKSLIRTGYFDPPDMQPYRQYNDSMVNTMEAQTISYRAALQSLTLLKNDNNVLPLKKSSSPLTIAVVGPMAKDGTSIQGNYRGKPPFVKTLFDGIHDEPNVHVTYVYGCDIQSNNRSGFAAAQAAAANADYTMYMGGMNEIEEREDWGGDRVNLTWPGVQEDLILALAAVVKTPIIVLVVGGGQIDHTIIRSSPGVGAILWVGYPSMFGGSAVADVVFGRYSPSGRLCTTSYPQAYTKVSMFDMSLRPNRTTGYPGRTYKWYNGETVYTFGYGLSYTAFTYTFLTNHIQTQQEKFTTEQHVDAAHNWLYKQQRTTHVDAGKAPFMTYAVNVTCTGSVGGATSVLLFMNSSAPDTPIQTLIGYVFIPHLNPGETVTEYFDVQINQMTYVDQMGDKWLLPADYTLFIGHAGHAEQQYAFTMNGEPTLLYRFPRQPEHNKVYVEKPSMYVDKGATRTRVQRVQEMR